MRVFATGGSGFLGGFVLTRLLGAGHQVYALARSDLAAARVARLGATPVAGDLDSPSTIDAAFRTGDPEALVNVASLGFGHAGTILAAAEDAGMTRALFVSTTAIFTSLNPYSKAVRIAAEEAAQASDLAWTIVRPTMIYGTPDDRNMWRLLQLVRRCPVVPLPDGGRFLVQPVHVDDVAGAIAAALGCPNAVGRSYNLAGPEPLTLAQVVKQAAAAVNKQPRIFSVPGRPVISALRAVEFTGRRVPLRAEQVERLLEDKVFDIAAARQDLNFAPRTFAAGIATEAKMTAA